MGTNWCSKVRCIATFLMAIVYLITVLTKVEFLHYVNNVLLGIVLVLSLIQVTGATRIIGYVLFLVGGILLLWFRVEPSLWLQGLNRNLYFVVMVVLVPLLGVPIRQGDYMESLRAFVRRYIRLDSQFYILTKSFTAFFGIMINMGVISLVHQIGQASEKSKNRRLLGSALSRGFSTTMIWSPSYAVVALVLELTGARWLEIFPVGLGLVVSAIILGWLMVRVEERKVDKEGIIEVNESSRVMGREQPDKTNWGKVIELGFFGILLIVSIVVFSELTGITTVTIVSILALVFPIFWLGIIGKLATFPKDVKDTYFGTNLPKTSNEVVMFLAAGFFATAINNSTISEIVPALLEGVIGNNSWTASITIILVLVVFSIVGIHPIITVTAIGSTLQAGLYGFSPAFFAIVLTAGSSIALTVSLNATSLMVGSLVDKTVLDVIKWNGVYTVILFVLTVVIINIFYWLGFI